MAHLLLLPPWTAETSRGIWQSMLLYTRLPQDVAKIALQYMAPVYRTRCRMRSRSGAVRLAILDGIVYTLRKRSTGTYVLFRNNERFLPHDKSGVYTFDEHNDRHPVCILGDACEHDVPRTCFYIRNGGVFYRVTHDTCVQVDPWRPTREPECYMINLHAAAQFSDDELFLYDVLHLRCYRVKLGDEWNQVQESHPSACHLFPDEKTVLRRANAPPMSMAACRTQHTPPHFKQPSRARHYKILAYSATWIIYECGEKLLLYDRFGRKISKLTCPDLQIQRTQVERMEHAVLFIGYAGDQHPMLMMLPVVTNPQDDEPLGLCKFQVIQTFTGGTVDAFGCERHTHTVAVYVYMGGDKRDQLYVYNLKHALMRVRSEKLRLTI